MQGKRSPGEVKRPWECLITQGGGGGDTNIKQVGNDNSGVCTENNVILSQVVCCSTLLAETLKKPQKKHGVSPCG